MSVAVPLRAVGFRAELEGASLWDLVQMECQGRSRVVVHVQGEGGVGFLYFADGRIVHAATTQGVGESAALEILGWTYGSFQPCQRPWPQEASIDMPCEALILQVAKRRDDEIFSSSNLVAFPLRSEIEIEDVVDEDGARGTSLPASGGGGPEEKGMANMRSPNIEPPSLTPPLGRVDPTADYPVVLRLAASGAVLRNKGASDEMAGVVAYAHRLVQLAGELMGLEDLVAMECQFTEGRCLIFNEENGELVALRPRPDTNLQSLRDKLGL